MMCAEGYYLNSESGACDKLNDCGAGLVMYIDGDTQVCRPCESMGCSKCTTDDPTNPYYDYCLECNAGLELNPMMGVCVKKVEKELDVGTVCAPGSFALVVPADGEQFVVCPSCPPGALGCAAVNATDIDNLEVKISAC